MASFPAIGPSPRLCSALLSALLLCGVLGCSSFDGGSDVLDTAALNPGVARGAPGFDWSCLASGAPSAANDPFVVAGETDRVIYSARIVDFTSRQLARGVTVRACVLTDVNCAQPVVSMVTADEDGWFDVPLFQGFDGYLEYVGDNYVQGTLYLTQPMVGSVALDFPLPIISLDSLSALGGLIGVTLNPAAGLIAVRSFDCQGVTADGVVLTKPGDGVPWYFADGLPTRAETHTSPDGFGGWINVPPGVAAVNALTPMGSSIAGEQRLLVRAGQVTVAYLAPKGTRPRAIAPR